MGNASISLITVCFNAEKYIENTILSLINQDYPAKEIIVIDGASKDNTLALIEKYTKNIKHIISESDKGIYDAMNKGLALATGDYVLFINAGDALHEASTLSQCFLQYNNADIIYGDTFISNQNWQIMGLRRLRPPKQLMFKDFSKGMLISHQAFIAKRKIAPQFDTSYSYSADFDWCVKILKESKSNYNSQIPIAHFMEGGQTSKTLIPGLKERFKIMIKHYGLLQTIWSHIFISFRLFRQL